MDCQALTVVGAGHAGITLAASLRSADCGSPITLISEETEPPYERPPLSKTSLKAAGDAGPQPLRSDRFYAEHGIELRLGQRAVAIDRRACEVLLDHGERLAYERLVLAPGSRARWLGVPGTELDGVLHLRSAADALRLRATLARAGCLVIVGAGFIGLEVAATARAEGVAVTVLEREDRVLPRVASDPVADFVERHHRHQGVEIELGVAVAELASDGRGRVAAVATLDGRRFDCDAVLVAVGAEPNVELAREAGLSCDAGIVVDEHGCTADPAVFAVGDATRQPLGPGGALVRLESVPGALDQARRVAAQLAGGEVPNPATPWFWSDQSELKLQIAGLSSPGDEQVVRVYSDQERLAVFHLRARRLTAVETVNSPSEFAVGRRLIGAAAPVDAELLADAGVTMRELAAVAGTV